MSPENQRTALALECKWKKCLFDNVSYYVPMQGKVAVACDPLNDLNAMHDIIMSEAEQKGFGFQADFQLKLQEVVERKRPHLNREQIGWWMNNATAAQRAEAFLRTKGLWKD